MRVFIVNGTDSSSDFGSFELLIAAVTPDDALYEATKHLQERRRAELIRTLRITFLNGCRVQLEKNRSPILRSNLEAR